MSVLVGYKKFYTVFGVTIICARYLLGMRVSYTAFLWAIWLVIWTSPPVLHWILYLFTSSRPQAHARAINESGTGKGHRRAPSVTETRRNTLYYWVHLYSVCTGFALVNVGPDPYEQGFLVWCIGWTMALIGFTGALWSRSNLGSEWRGAPEVRRDHKLITTGPYHWVRHPIYTSLTLMMLGSAISSGHWINFVEVVYVFSLYSYKSIVEERMLVDHFGPSYETYKKRTAMLIPFVL